MIVRLTDDTVGYVEKARIGENLLVSLQDENGNHITKKGIVAEILED